MPAPSIPLRAAAAATAVVADPAGQLTGPFDVDARPEPASGAESLDRGVPARQAAPEVTVGPNSDGRPAPIATRSPEDGSILTDAVVAAPGSDVDVAAAAADVAAPVPDRGPAPEVAAPAPDRFAAAGPIVGDARLEERSGCTAAQLRRFIKSRAYVPLHELRRRFELSGDEDDVSPIDLGDRRLFVGLPHREARLLGELFEAGDVGYELLLDPASPLVVGVFPMRPVPRS